MLLLASGGREAEVRVPAPSEARGPGGLCPGPLRLLPPLSRRRPSVPVCVQTSSYEDASRVGLGRAPTASF